jgi:hypothetical protein
MQAAHEAVTLPWMVKRSVVLTMSELPRVIAVCAVLFAAVVPLAVAVLAGQWWLTAIASLPAALLLTGLAQFATIVVRGDRPRVREVFVADPMLALTITAVATVAGLMLATPELQIPGFVVAALALVLVPYALAYGAVRGKRGLTTWRGAFILVAYRPSWALTVLSVSILGAFAIVATAGALFVVVPGLIAILASLVVGWLLDGIDNQGNAQTAGRR